MTAPVLRIEAPSDAQLCYIRGLCDEYGWQHPDAVASKAEASAIITAMKDGSYRAADWAWTADPFRDSDIDYYSDEDGVPF
jgi:hypothetical protein